MRAESKKRTSPTTARTAKVGAPRKRVPVGRQAWLDTARQALIEEGTAGIEINKLAKRLSSTRGGFYWFFASRQQLLDELAAYWAETSTAPFENIVRTAGRSGLEESAALAQLWVEESDYDPKWDGAVRDWARTSLPVRKLVAAVDQRRIRVLEKIFVDLGFKGKDALIRARVTYYHQVGYYALGVQESRQKRRELLPYYQKVLIGRGP
jgi:AcrR family transcriptional regulator